MIKKELKEGMRIWYERNKEKKDHDEIEQMR